MRRPAALSLTLALLVLTAGCGGEDEPKASATPTPLTSAQASAVASAGVLTEADMPGYEAEPQEADADDDATEAAIAACLDLGTPTYVARDPGRSFSRGELSVDSSVDVVESEAKAKAELEAMASPKGVECIKGELSKVITGLGGTVKTFELKEVEVTEVPDAFCYEVSASFTVAGQTISSTGYELGSVVGPAEISLTVENGSAAERLTKDEAVALLKKASDRAREAL